MNKSRQNKPDFLTPGTVSCALFSGITGVVIAVLLLSIGFWKTLFIFIMLCIGLFIGGVEDKRTFLKSFADKTIPGKTDRIYKADDVQIRKRAEEKDNASDKSAAESACEEADPDEEAPSSGDSDENESSEEEASDETGGDASENESAEPAEDGQTEKPAE